MKFTWNNEVKAEFIKSSIEDIDMENLLEKMVSLESSPSQENTDLLCKELNEQFLKVAISSKAYKSNPPKSQEAKSGANRKFKKRPPKKPWEDEEFCKARTEYRSHKNKLKRKGQKSACQSLTPNRR